MLFNPDNYIQSQFTTLPGTGATTTSTSFATLVSVSITTSSDFIWVFATASADVPTAGSPTDGYALQFGIFVNGTQKTFAQATSITNGISTGMGMTYHGAVAAGTQTVTLQWAIVTAGTNGNCNPSTNFEHASLLVVESKV
jgi:hypothetical protein